MLGEAMTDLFLKNRIDMPEPSSGLQFGYTGGIGAAEVEVVCDGNAVRHRRAMVRMLQFLGRH
jgi:hypothetical protein